MEQTYRTYQRCTVDDCDDKTIEHALRAQSIGKGRSPCEPFEPDDTYGQNRNVKQESYNPKVVRYRDHKNTSNAQTVCCEHPEI